MFSIGQILLTIIIVVFTYLVYIATKVYLARKLLKKWLSQAPTYPIIGSILEFGPSTETINDFVRLTNNPEKSVYLDAFGEWGIISRDYDLMEFILSSNEHLVKGTDYINLIPWLGKGLLVSDGKKWKNRRRVITPAFHFSILEQFVEIFNTNEDIFIDRLKREAAGKKGVEIYSYILDCALDIICETAMGVKMGAQQNNNQEYTAAVATMCEIFAERLSSIWKTFDICFRFSKDYKRQQECLKILHDFTNNVIEKRKRNKSDSSVEEKDELGRKRKKALLDVLLESNIDGQPLSQEDIREEVDTFMFAGHDTTSSAITSGLMVLSTRPDIQNTIRQELREVIGKNRDRPITYQDIHDMSYLELVAKEILRLYPSAPIISRKIQRDVEYKGNVIPKETVITLFLYGINRDPDFYEEPERFNPDRFLEQNKRKTYSFVPFSAGPRNCIGQKYAMLELKSMLAKILMNFEVLPSDIPHKPEMAIEVVLKSKNGVYVKLKPIEWV